MNVLIACEESGTVREAFRRMGHNAWSCDIVETSQPGNHYRCDVIQLLAETRGFWDLMIAHPPCTHLSTSGARWATDHWVNTQEGRYWHDGSEKRRLREEALQFAEALWNADIPRIGLEQPISVLASRIGKSHQRIHPYQHGHEEFKTTCLWLKALPLLKATNYIEPPSPDDYAEHQRWSVTHRMVPGPDRARLRSVTFPGIAEAMAQQWGRLPVWPRK